MLWKFNSNAIEFRGLQEYTNKDGKTTITIIVEDDDASQNRIRCADPSRFTELAKLLRGERYSFPVVIRDGSYNGQTFTSCNLGDGPIQYFDPDKNDFDII